MDIGGLNHTLLVNRDGILLTVQTLSKLHVLEIKVWCDQPSRKLIGEQMRINFIKSKEFIPRTSYLSLDIIEFQTISLMRTLLGPQYINLKFVY